MRRSPHSLSSLVAASALLILTTSVLAGCGSADDSEVSRDLDMVTVNWIEGLAMTYMQEQILEDEYDMEVEVNEVQGGGIAFSSVADGDADFFNEAWLPTTHEGPWSKYEGDLQKLDYTYRGTTAGLAVPAYMDIEDVSELGDFREALDGEINGIESGANVNDQARQILENNDVEGFSVVAASGPATWQSLESAIENEEPIVVTGWQPHWKWSEYDLKYLEGAQTGQTDVFGEPEDIFTIVDNDFIDRYPREVVCFLKEFEANDEQVGSLMFAFKDRGDTSREDAMKEWIDNNPDHVEQWLSQAEECANSDAELEPLPDDATHSSQDA
ncbi:MAG: glycine betaine ABC transporter substrate-binding protein [Salinibacter sp.]